MFIMNKGELKLFGSLLSTYQMLPRRLNVEIANQHLPLQDA
jgi:hypothetical protein